MTYIKCGEYHYFRLLLQVLDAKVRLVSDPDVQGFLILEAGVIPKTTQLGHSS